MKNQGKIFEQDFQKSVPDYALLYRIPDPAQAFGGSANTRFSRHNPFDFLLWDSKRRVLYALEAKTVKGKSISFERDKSEHGEIHYYQVAGLNAWNQYDGVTCGFVIEFRELERTVFLEIDDYNRLVSGLEKKSFNFGDLEDSGLPFVIIPQIKKRTRYVYDVEKFLSREEKENSDE